MLRKGRLTAAGDEHCDLSREAFTDKGVLVNSGEFDGLSFDQAFAATRRVQIAAHYGGREALADVGKEANPVAEIQKRLLVEPLADRSDIAAR